MKQNATGTFLYVDGYDGYFPPPWNRYSWSNYIANQLGISSTLPGITESARKAQHMNHEYWFVSHKMFVCPAQPLSYESINAFIVNPHSLIASHGDRVLVAHAMLFGG